MPGTEIHVEDVAACLERLIVTVRRLAPAQGMSLTAVSTLRSLEASGPRRLSELATDQGVTQPAMTQLVTRLQRDGYAHRGGSPDDARVVLVSITAAGRELLRRRRELRTRELGRLLDRLPAHDRAAVFAAVPALNLLADLGQPDDRSHDR